MLKANEFRIGNLINPIDRSQAIHLPVWMPMIITRISTHWIHAIKQKDGLIDIDYHIRDISPIKLTPEILKKCGFVKSGSYWFKDNVYLYLHGLVDCTFHLESIMDNKNSLEIEYVHQLQNLFYALKGKELEIKIIINN